MELQYDHWTGTFEEVKKSLTKSIRQYITNNEKVKIGITNNPERRCKEHDNSNKKWAKMVVKYQTSSEKYINEMEKILIDNFFDYIENEVAGGGGPNGDSPYYLYVLLR